MLDRDHSFFELREGRGTCTGKFDQNTFRKELQLNGGSILKWRFVLIENDVGDNASGHKLSLPYIFVAKRLFTITIHPLRLYRGHSSPMINRAINLARRNVRVEVFIAGSLHIFFITLKLRASKVFVDTESTFL